MLGPILKKHLKKFFSFLGVQKAIEENNFDEVFKAWDKYREELRRNHSLDFNYILTWQLISFLDEINIDWIDKSTIIPDFALWFYPKEKLEIPTNIKEIGDFILTSSLVKEITYLGTKEEWNNIKKSSSAIEKAIPIHCIDGDINNE